MNPLLNLAVDTERYRIIMKSPRRKLIGGILLLALLTCLFTGVLLYANTFFNALYDMMYRDTQMKTLCRSVQKELDLYSSVSSDVLARNMRKAALSSNVIRDEIKKKSGGEPCLYENSAVIRAEGKKVDFPKGFPEDIRFDAEQIPEDDGLLYSRKVEEKETGQSYHYAITCIHLEGPLYYIQWKDVRSLEKEIESYFDLNSCLLGIENTFHVNLLLFSPEPDENGTHLIMYVSDHLPAYSTAEEYGITEDMISSAVDRPDTLSPAGRIKAYTILAIDGRPYELFLQKLDSSAFPEATIMAYLIPYAETGKMLSEQALLILAVFLIIAIVFIVWLFSSQLLVRDHRLNDSQKHELGPRVLTRKSFSFIAVGWVIILLAYALFLSLFRLYSTCQQVNSGLLSMQQRIKENQTQSASTQSALENTYEEYALLIGQNLEKYPEYANKEHLQAICDYIGAEYIMLFNSNGDETMTNSRYVNLSLGKDASFATFDFRRLLTGTPMIRHEPALDETSGKENVLIGVSYGAPEGKEGYQALLLAVPKEQITAHTAESTTDIMTALVAEDMLAFSVDPEISLIVDASDSALVGKNALDLGLPERGLRSGYRDFFKLDGLSYYGECGEKDGLLYYYAARSSHIYQFVLPASLAVSVIAFLLLMILTLYFLFGYRKFFEKWSEIGEELMDSENVIRLSNGRRKYSKDPSKRWRPSVEVYGVRTPFHMARVALEVMGSLFIILVGVRFLSSRTGSNTSLITFILQGNWAKGVNLFSFTSILILFAEVVLAVIIVQTLLRLISGALGTRGETVCRLLISLTSYIGVIFFIYFALFYLGFEPGTLLASLGLGAFAVSLGAKDLITDIIAGLSIVFEGEYQVGDIIDVGGYRGEVLEIGVRTTKLEGTGGNIKIIGNRDIKNVINMTRMNSWYPLEVSICLEDLDAVEKLLAEELPRIGESIPEIISGPDYKGIVSMGKGTVTVAVVAEFKESAFFKVQRSLNRSIQKLFEQNHIRIM